eukprot:53150-Ditylum_brightwellii.AAC.1
MPQKLSYSLLKTVVDIVSDGLINGNWRKENATVYLKCHGIYDATVKDIIEHDCNEQLALELNNLLGVCVQGQSLQNHIDTPMHLLLGGIIKTVVSKIKYWTKIKCKNTTFLTHASGVHNSVMELGLA